MIIEASDAILWTRTKIASERHLELLRDCDKLRANYYINKSLTRAVIRSDSPSNRARLAKRALTDKANVVKLTSDLVLSINHSQCTAAWVCNTRIDGPLQHYMRVMPLPVRTYI
jgi:hypothetical protein